MNKTVIETILNDLQKQVKEEEKYYGPTINPDKRSFSKGGTGILLSVRQAKQVIDHIKDYTYTEKEVEDLITLAWATASAYGKNTNQKDCDSWFNCNKKKNDKTTNKSKS